MISCSGDCESGRRKCVRKMIALFGRSVGVGDWFGTSEMYEVALWRREVNIAVGVAAYGWVFVLGGEG